MDKKDIIAQWAFDTRPILGRFHLWLEDVTTEWIRQEPEESPHLSFVEPGLERMFVMTAALTALGGRLFGRYGDGAGKDKHELNVVKKDADAITAYVMSECLWYLSRSLPENHAIMVSLGEGLMPKVGETPEMGSNPLLGFGRVYARPRVAKFVDKRVQQLINDPKYTWQQFYREIKNVGITIWGTAIDTLENTSRFAKGEATGPMTVLHVFDQPLCVSQPYEGYMGNLVLPKKVRRKAEEMSVLLNFFTPRKKVLSVIQTAYPKVATENIHVWTLRGASREPRIGKLWQEWQDLGVHLIDDHWELPSGYKAFTDSGTYAPCFIVKTWEQDGQEHLLICDGYAASAEAMQAASLSPLLDLEVSLALFSSKFELSYEREALIMRLDPDSDNFGAELSEIFEKTLDEETITMYREQINIAKKADVPFKTTISVDDFFPEKDWRVMALCGYMLPDPYSGAPEVKKIGSDSYAVTVRLATRKGEKLVTVTLRLMQDFQESHLIFNPLLVRFMRGENYRDRPVKISDSGRVRNELQTLCSEALEHFDENGIRIYFSRIPQEVIDLESQKILRDVLTWYRDNYPIWFRWLEIYD